MTALKRLSYAERHRQLLDCAFEILFGEGTATLTLPALAARAGVSRPIVYEHFGTRERLLIEMYQDYDERLMTAMRRGLEDEGRDLLSVARVLSATYVDHVAATAPECERVTAALVTYEETRRVMQASRAAYIELFRKAVAPFTAAGPEEVTAIVTGFLGAVELLALQAAAGSIGREAAIGAAVRLLMRSLT